MILGIIQARMNSTRLHGKVLLPIFSKPILWHIFQRLQFSKKIDFICISTSNEKSDDPIAQFANANNLPCYRGSEDDLISRHLGAAKKFNADTIVRITGDNPLVDPEIVDNVISLYSKHLNADFVSNSRTHTFPPGLDVEVIPIETLEKLLPISKNKIFYEYFINMYIYQYPDKFISKELTMDPPNNIRLTLDYFEDYVFIKEIYAQLYKESQFFNLDDILILLQKKPKLTMINSMHTSKLSYLKYLNEK
jgi:spore coat polysaccharide biosynthesis protein SpsF